MPGAQEIEGQSPQDGEVFGTFVGAVAGGVLVEGDVEDPCRLFSMAQWGRTARAKRCGVRRAEER